MIKHNYKINIYQYFLPPVIESINKEAFYIDLLNEDENGVCFAY